jgi:hypothetical protein
MALSLPRRSGAVEHLSEVVDLEGRTETCRRLTPWTTGFEVAWRTYQHNMVAPFSDLSSTVEEVIEGQHTVVVRSHIEATRTGDGSRRPALYTVDSSRCRINREREPSRVTWHSVPRDVRGRLHMGR